MNTIIEFAGGKLLMIIVGVLISCSGFYFKDENAVTGIDNYGPILIIIVGVAITLINLIEIFEEIKSPKQETSELSKNN